jgi:hypothetical protein
MMGRSLFSPAQNGISARVALELPVPGRRPRRRRAAVRSEATSPGNPNLPFPNPLPSPSHPFPAVSTGRGGVATRRSRHTAELYPPYSEVFFDELHLKSHLCLSWRFSGTDTACFSLKLLRILISSMVINCLFLICFCSSCTINDLYQLLVSLALHIDPSRLAVVCFSVSHFVMLGIHSSSHIVCI